MSIPTIDAILAAPLERENIEAAARLLHADPAGWPAIEVRAHELLVEPKTLFATWRTSVRSCADIIRKAEAEAAKVAKKMEAEAERLRRKQEREAEKQQRQQEREEADAARRGETREWAEAQRAGGVPVFARADAATLARTLHDAVGAGSPQPLAFDLGQLWRFDGESKLWEALPEPKLKVQLADWSGSMVLGKRGWTELEIQRTAPILDLAYAFPSDWGWHEGFFRASPRGVPMATTFLRVSEDVSELVSEPLTHEHRLTWKLPFDWTGEGDGAACPKWSRYLETVFEGEVDGDKKALVLQEFAGAALLGLAPRYQQVLLLVGAGSNGKSVFLDVIKELIPAPARSAVKPHDLGHEYYLAQLQGKRLNIVSEMPAGELLSSENFKAAVAGDLVSGRHPAGRVFDFHPEAAWLVSANELPSVQDHSHGFWRRWIAIDFKRVFAGADIIRNLSKQIVEQEMPGVTAWALDGARRLLAQNGYTQVQAVAQAVLEWRTDSDLVLAFLTRYCELDAMSQNLKGEKAHVWTQARTLYDDFEQFCKREVRLSKYPSPNAFGRRLKGHGVHKDDHHNFTAQGGSSNVAGYRLRSNWGATGGDSWMGELKV